ncbi:hypothetical protein MTO96_010457 [Rhipicephalus appendiculatus]
MVHGGAITATYEQTEAEVPRRLSVRRGAPTCVFGWTLDVLKPLVTIPGYRVLGALGSLRHYPEAAGGVRSEVQLASSGAGPAVGRLCHHG